MSLWHPRSLVEISHSMLLDAKLLKKFWAKAVSTAVYLNTLFSETETAFKAMKQTRNKNLTGYKIMKATQKQDFDQIRGAMEATQREEFAQVQGTLDQRMDSIQSRLQISSHRSSNTSTAGSCTLARLPILIQATGPISTPPILLRHHQPFIHALCRSMHPNLTLYLSFLLKLKQMKHLLLSVAFVEIPCKLPALVFCSVKEVFGDDVLSRSTVM